MNDITSTENPVMGVMNSMLSQVHWDDAMRMQSKRIFYRRDISSDDGYAMHTAIRADLEKENDGMKVKAELFALLYICQPEALFRRRRLTRTVRGYASRHLGLGIATVSAQKQNLAFLYFNDKVFRAVALRAIEAATNAISKENS